MIAAAVLWSPGVSDPPRRERDCPLVVRNVRAKTVADTSYEARHPELAEPGRPDSVAGPGSSWLVVRRVGGTKPTVYMRRPARPTAAGVVPPEDRVEPLFGTMATAPLWSPDGKLVSAVLWESAEHPRGLAIMDVATRAVRKTDVRAHVIHYKWSPNSKWIAVHGQSWDTNRPLLAWVRASDGHGVVLDTIPVFAECDFTWSPDSRHVVAAIPTLAFSDDDYCAAELWLYADFGRTRCQLSDTPDDAEDDPAWISDLAIQYNVHRCEGRIPGPDSARVMEFRAVPAKR